MTSSEPTESEPEAETAPGQEGETQNRQESKRRLPRFVGVSIQSKLMLMLLSCSIMSVAVIGVIGYEAGRNAMRAAVSDRLIELRESQKRAVETLFRDLTNSLIVDSRRGSTAVEAVQAFTAGFDQLADATINPAQQEAIVSYYNNKLIGPIERTTGEKLDVDTLQPSSNAQKYLQAFYTAPFCSGGDSIRVPDDAGGINGSAWSAANARFNSYFRGDGHPFLNIGTRCCWTTPGQRRLQRGTKVPTSGTNILTGPYRESYLRDAYEKGFGRQRDRLRRDHRLSAVSAAPLRAHRVAGLAGRHERQNRTGRYGAAVAGSPSSTGSTDRR